MRNIKLTLSYDGTDFHGWQRQPGLRTVQEVLEDATDSATGHAAGDERQRAHRCRCTRPGPGCAFSDRFASLQTRRSFGRSMPILPHDMRVLAAEERPQAFHATLDAKSKRYRYAIDNGTIADVFQLGIAGTFDRPLDAAAMVRAGVRSWDGTTSAASRPNGPIARAACEPSSI